MRDVGNRKKGLVLVAVQLWDQNHDQQAKKPAQGFLEVLKRVGGICLPSDGLSESECENETAPVSHEKKASCQEHHMLNPKSQLICDVFQSNVLYFGMYPTLTQVDSDAERRRKQSNNNKSQLFLHCQLS